MTAGTRELTCRELADFLADYFAGELGPNERSLFEGHLAECPDCVAYLRSYAETMQLAKDAYDDDRIPADVPDELVRAILEARKRFRRAPPTPWRRPRRRS
jgi:anti-sigma factor RsiW